MKKLWQAGISFLLLLALMTGLAAPALAEDATITFDGTDFTFSPGSTYTSTDLFDNFKNVMPGDVLTQSITFKNEAQDYDYVKLYLKAVPHPDEHTQEQPMSEKVLEAEKTLESMNEFLSQLTMKVWNGADKTAEPIFEGAPNAAFGAVELGRVNKDETAALTVELEVPIELGIEYMYRVGEVDWVFTVEAFRETQLTVRKVWDDGNYYGRPDSVKVNLLRDGQTVESVELTAETGWVHTFDKLDADYTWTVEEETAIPGYDAPKYTVNGNEWVIVNSRPWVKPEEPGYMDLTVRKVWNDNGFGRPEFVTVTLYNGERAVDTVTLSAANGWSYTWRNLAEYDSWQIVESNIPKGYVPYYSARYGTVTITNTATLIQTGQLNWPIWVLGGAGLVLILGGAVVLGKKKRENA